MAAARDLSSLPIEEQRKILARRERDRRAAACRRAINPDRMRQTNRKSHARCRENRLIALKRRYVGQREARLKYAADYYEKNRGRVASQKARRNKERREGDIQFRLSANIRTRLSEAIRTGQKSGSAIEDLGCSISELMSYLEDQFEPGMTWENYGRRGWHIDHIIPLAFFDLTDHQQFLSAVHWTNLKPKWWFANVKKGATMEPPTIF